MNDLTPVKAPNGILKFNGTEVRFNPSLFNYLYLESKFEPVIKDSIISIKARFSDEIGNMNDYIANIDSFLSSVFNPLCDFAIKQLSMLGCYSYDRETFFRRYVEPKFDRVLAIRDALMDENARIENIQAMRDSMRTYRRRSAVLRDRLRGSSDDGLLTNIGHGVFNTIAKAADEALNSGEREKFFKEIEESVKNELTWIAEDMPGAVAELLYQEVGGEDYRDPRTPDDFQKAENIFKNLKDRNIPESQIDQAAIEVFALNPQLEGFLPWCVKRYGDPNGEFELAASLFRVDILKTKMEMLNEVVILSSKSSAIESKAALEEKQKELSISVPELMQKIDNAIVKLDIEERTADGVLYDTVEEAKNARLQKWKMLDIIEKGDSETEDGIKAILSAFDEKGLDLPFVEEKRKVFQEKLIQLDKDYRTVEGVEYKTREEADDVKRQLKEILDILSTGDQTTEDGIKTILDTFEKKAFNPAFTEKHIKVLQKKLIQLDLEYRTVDGIEFKTREEADIGKHELAEVTRLSERYHLDNPEVCQAFLSEIAAMKLKTSVAEKIIGAAKKRLASQKDKIEQIVKKYSISQDEAVILLTKHSLLSRSEIPGLKMFDLVDTNTSEQAITFGVPSDDIILGFLNIYNNMKKGILISQKGFYSLYIPFQRTKIGFSAIALLHSIIIFLCFLFYIQGDGDSSFMIVLFITLFMVLLVLGVLALIFNKLIFKHLKWDKMNQAVFIKENDALFSLSSDKRMLYLNKETSIPLFSNLNIAKDFEKIKQMVKDLQELDR
jgi:hypothetical protein